MINIPRLVISAPQGKSGKTTVTIGILSALVNERHLTVQPFKKGPDFIDPGWLTRITGKACRNLDSFLMTREAIRSSFINHAAGADVSIIEGAMGLYDGVDLQGSGSTAEIARILQSPVILVVDCTRMTRSVAAMVTGFMHFDQEIEIAGIILNNVARSRHEQILRTAVEEYCGIPVLGAFPRGANLCIPDRHLGLIPAMERDEFNCISEEIGRAAIKYLDLEGLLNVARSAPPLPLDNLQDDFKEPKKDNEDKPVIGLFRDRVFTFYYPENLEALENAGAKIVNIDSINDHSLPEVDALYLGGGFPEVFARELEANYKLRASIKEKVEAGLPVYAECGGLIYLARQINWGDKTYQMSGALPFDVAMCEKPQGHGYVILEVEKENPFFSTRTIIRGHEFHHTHITSLDESKISFAFKVARGWGIDGKRDGLLYKNVLAAYSHIHALSAKQWAASLVNQAIRYRRTYRL